ncbi:hypothetical protein [Streptosporangium sp. OZ121]|uniref:hypothetical protein n=1 Tax=Streptosporangium sp. OZ121 TaxID=3444183 RepID=UPI003F7A48E1
MPRTKASAPQTSAASESEPLPRQRPAQIRHREAVWTKLKQTGAHLREDTDARLTAFWEQTQRSLQDTFEDAINAYCDKLRIPKTMKPDSELAIPRNPGLVPAEPNGYTTRKIGVRLQPNTRARLVAACKKEQLGGTDLFNDALNDYFDKLGIPTVDRLGPAAEEE